MSDKLNDDRIEQQPSELDETTAELGETTEQTAPTPVDFEGHMEGTEETTSAECDPSAEQKGGKKKKKERKKLTPEQKKKRTKRALIITGCVVLVLAIFFSGIAIGNTVGTKALIKQAQSMKKVQYTEHTQLKPVKKTSPDGEWTYFVLPDDRDEFKVLQFTDVHIGGGSFSGTKDAWAMNAVETMIRAEQPDLVIVTGDIAYPVPFQAGTFNNLSATKIFSNMMESLGVYWTFAYGNHDTEAYSMYSRKQISEYYENSNFEYCLYDRGFADDEDKFGHIDKGFGNHIINVKRESGEIIQSLVILDSHSYTDGDYFGIAWKYDNIHQSQVDWYASEMEKLKAKNAELDNDAYPESLAFFHIPLLEYREAWKALSDKYNNKPSRNDTAVVPENKGEGRAEDTVKFYYGKMDEKPKTRHGVESYGIFCGYGTDTLFETGLTHGLKGIFCGHDHYNNFSIEYMGIRLTYGMSVDYLAYPGIYKEHSQRGCTVITLTSKGTFDCEPRNYYADYGVAHEKG